MMHDRTDTEPHPVSLILGSVLNGWSGDFHTGRGPTCAHGSNQRAHRDVDAHPAGRPQTHVLAQGNTRTCTSSRLAAAAAIVSFTAVCVRTQSGHHGWPVAGSGSALKKTK